VELTDYTDDLWPPIDPDPRDPDPPDPDPRDPIYDEIPEGEIDVKTGVTDAYQVARDALVNADTVTQVDDAEELEIPPFDESVFELIDTPPSVDAGTLETRADASAPVDDVITPDYTQDMWPAIDEIDTPDYTQDMWPAVDEVATPDYTQDMWPAIDELTAQDMFEMTLFDLMAQELLTGGGGGGGRSNNFNIVSYE